MIFLDGFYSISNDMLYDMCKKLFLQILLLSMKWQETRQIN